MQKKTYVKFISIVLSLLLLSGCVQTESKIKNNPTNESKETSIEKTELSNDDMSHSLKKHKVTFKDHDGTILKVELVDEGMSATPPENASKEGYKIVKWDESFDKVEEDIVVKPVYEKISGPTIFADNKTAKAGDTVKISIKLSNNPGINGASIKVSFDSALTLKNIINGEALEELKFTKPGELSNPCLFLWDGVCESVKRNGEMLILSFKVSDTAKSGEKLGISVSYIDGEIYDKDLNNVDFDVVGGSITIE